MSNIKVYIEGLKGEFLWFTMLYGMQCAFLVIITHEQHECVIINKKVHKIPYHTVNHFNEACNPFLPREFVSLH